MKPESKHRQYLPYQLAKVSSSSLRIANNKLAWHRL